ncbi:MAG: hypothetical protein ACK46X_14115 [Candidatus Sericytochromatia bacterium]
MGEFSYAQPDFGQGYGYDAGFDPNQGYETNPGYAPDQGYQMAGYQAELAALIPQDMPLLAAILLEKGVLAQDTAQAALARQAESGDSLAQVLLEGGWAAPDQLVEALQTRASYR